MTREFKQTSDDRCSTNKINIGISSCLLGERVRFDSGHKNNAYITKILSKYFEFHSFCPEVSIGLGIPREPIRLVSDEIDGSIKCVGTRNPSLDVTEPLIRCAENQLNWVENLSGYIFKKDSPSCGMERVKIYNNGNPSRSGTGIYASVIMKYFPNLPVEEEGRLGDAHIRENFIKRVFIYKRWCDLLTSSPSKKDLVNFHAQHKLIYISHSQSKTKALGQLVAEIGKMEISQYCESYIGMVTNILRKPANRKNHANVLKHIQGYLKHELDKGDKDEMATMIEEYRLGYIPLVVPITVLRHHFRRHPIPYIDMSYYMQPHPKDLMLQNTL
ncbi:YbgA family protein [Agarilytica rhodophyticola]|uniref:YbgA family protein n=1 Tax=Agarilytica rhodophyticola TaxID=1737490 RepID=UPI000B3480B4|nr:DUF523 and DUF1722 domain-containing protein [Agarilytica rhodophyticola]